MDSEASLGFLLWLQLEAKKKAFFRQLPPFQGSEAISSGYRFSGAKTRERMGPTSEIRERETGLVQGSTCELDCKVSRWDALAAGNWAGAHVQ
jgi:hypothetical protein